MPKLGQKPRCIGIVGSRRRDSEEDWRKVWEVFDEHYRPGDTIVSGGCEQGADSVAERIAKQRGITITVHYPRKEDLNQELLKTNPRAAYAIINYARNTLIAKQADLLIAFVAPDRKGGTEDTIKKFLRRQFKDRWIIYA